MTTDLPMLVVCMGVSGCGKSTLARQLSREWGFTFIEADDLHPPENLERMASGQALEDRHRAPWMEAVLDTLDRQAKAGKNCILAHSGLRRAHRDQIRQSTFRTRFLFLQGDRDLIAGRMNNRDHFMPATLLDSQFDALEEPEGEADVIHLDTSKNIHTLASLAQRRLRASYADNRKP